MLWVYIISIVAVVLLIRNYSANKRMLPYGTLDKRMSLKVEKTNYVVEQYTFEDSIDSYRFYRKVVFDYSAMDGLQMTHYDLYDWSFTYFIYKNYSFRVNRFGNNLQCIRSKAAVSLQNFEMDLSNIISQNQTLKKY